MILSKTITTSKATILIVGGLPEEILELKITDQVIVPDGNGKRITILWRTREKAENEDIEKYLTTCVFHHSIIGLSGNWQLIGKLHEVTEEQWKEIVDWHINDDLGLLCKNYLDDHLQWRTVAESGLSLIEANCKLRNPVPLPEPDDGKYFDIMEANWHEEQETVFTNPVIFLKKKQSSK